MTTAILAISQSSAWAADDAADDGLSTIVVTGTRISRAANQTMSPVSVISSDQLSATGRASLKDALIAIDPSYANSPVYAGQLGFAGKAATLRGLAANETLVLINGRRRHSQALPYVSGSSAGQSPTDLDLIPASAIDHVEVLRDGAAAQYGSDAIAGVINIILKSSDHGGSADLSYGQYGETVGKLGDFGRTESAQLSQGFTLGDGGFVTVFADLLNAANTNYGGYVPYTTRIYPLVNGQPDPRENQDRYKQIAGQPARKKAAVGYNLETGLNDDVTAYSNATYTYRHSAGFTWYRTAASAQNIPSIYPDGYMPELVTNDSDYQVIAGLKGKDFLGWAWDVSSSLGQDVVHAYNNGTLNPSLGTASPRDFYLGSLISTEWVNDVDLKRQVDTTLFKAPLTVAVGGEFRLNGFKEGEGEYLSYANGGYVFPAGQTNAGIKPNPGASGVSGFTPADAGSHWRHDWAGYVDLDQRLTDRWEVGLAGRYEFYNDVANTLSGKVSTRYDLVDGLLAVRGNINSGFHAPSLQQQFFSSTTNSYTTVAGVQKPLSAVTAAVNNPMAIALGGRDLKPEKSVNKSVGVVLTPFKDFEASVDAYQINVTNQIVPVTMSTATTGGAAVRKILQAAGYALNAANEYSVVYERNAANTVTKGIDLSISYRTHHGDLGDVTWTVQSNQNFHAINSINPLASALTAAGVAAVDRQTIGYLTTVYPRNVTRFSATWFIDDFDVTPRVSRYSQARNLSNNGAAADETVKPAFIFDLDLGWRVTEYLKLSIGGQNIFNKRPETLSAVAQSYSGFPQVNPNYSTVSPYGDDGGYYYAKASFKW
ncbi:TonB-dependent receptor plug domain-containing protein [Nitrospirillum iridis]|uniref:Iron complex outermembrane receptor protein n=1 Tax=Nitrospirillum iridis TaxID=765888 RepID=A0A7X0B400_9PROT|nr:TonB-dependent receptor [Nitrospirillum iridis]MBB6255319.1 iron complex outermembrane receptor protein [Nitrospirillum iridis]